MATLAQAEAAHYGRMDAAYQAWLDQPDPEVTEDDAHEALAAACSLQDLEDDDWELSHLESRNGFDRYELYPGVTFWSCPECGGIDADPLTGCDSCGWKTYEWYEDQEEAA